MSEFLDRVVQQVDRIGDINIRPAAILIFFDEGREDVELVALFGPGGGTPEFFNLPDRCRKIVIVSNRDEFPSSAPSEYRDGQGVDPIVLGMCSDKLDERSQNGNNARGARIKNRWVITPA